MSQSSAAERAEERIRDAAEIEEATKNLTRKSARTHIQRLLVSLKEEANALELVEASQSKADISLQASSISLEEKASVVEGNNEPDNKLPEPQVANIAAGLTPKYVSVDRFSFDAGGYNSQFVSIYIPLPGVGAIPRSDIECTFTSTSFDLIVKNLDGKSHRMFKNNMEKDIDPTKSKYVVKADKIVVKVAKVKGEYGSYDSWSTLTAKKTKKNTTKKEDPSESIMDLMKDMYESGDDNMKKMIGETMLKQQRGEMSKGLDDDFGKYDM